MRIASAGHISLDITPSFNNTATQDIKDLFVPGKLINVGSAAFTLGGSVSNTGLAMSRLGADVYLMAKIGNDILGRILLEKLNQYRFHNYIKVSENESTSYSIVIAPKGTDRIFFHDPGCNNTFDSFDMDFSVFDSIDHFHFGYPPLMKKIYENNGNELIKIMKAAKEHNLTTSLDMALMDPSTAQADLDWTAILSEVLPYVDFFVPSIEELSLMTDRPKYDKWQRAANGDDTMKYLSLSEDVIPIADRAIRMGAKVVLLKCGIAGMYLRTAADSVMSACLPKLKNWGDVSVFEESYVPDRVLSGTGAGDTSIAAFLLSALSGNTPRETLQYAAGTGACCVSEYDTISGLLPFEDLRNKIDSGWEKQHYIHE